MKYCLLFFILLSGSTYAADTSSRPQFPGGRDEDLMTVEKLKEILERIEGQKAGQINLDGDQVTEPQADPEDDHG